VNAIHQDMMELGDRPATSLLVEQGFHVPSRPANFQERWGLAQRLGSFIGYLRDITHHHYGLWGRP
jgi:hypothetical protein